MPKFKVGDKVVCIAPEGPLEQNKVYTVTDVAAANHKDSGGQMLYFHFQGFPDGWFASRFKIYFDPLIKLTERVVETRQIMLDTQASLLAGTETLRKQLDDARVLLTSAQQHYNDLLARCRQTDINHAALLAAREAWEEALEELDEHLKSKTA